MSRAELIKLIIDIDDTTLFKIRYKHKGTTITAKGTKIPTDPRKFYGDECYETNFHNIVIDKGAMYLKMCFGLWSKPPFRLIDLDSIEELKPCR